MGCGGFVVGCETVGDNSKERSAGTTIRARWCAHGGQRLKETGIKNRQGNRKDVWWGRTLSM